MSIYNPLPYVSAADKYHVQQGLRAANVVIAGRARRTPDYPTLVDKEEIYVFVYGTLMKSFSNNTLLVKDERIGFAETVDSSFRMYAMGSIPGVIRAKEGFTGYKIAGELYRIKPQTILRLDALESNGSFYTREEVPVITSASKKEHTAWMYVCNHVAKKDRLCPVIDHAYQDWHFAKYR